MPREKVFLIGAIILDILLHPLAREHLKLGDQRLVSDLHVPILFVAHCF